jgi:hypothetical protein
VNGLGPVNVSYPWYDDDGKLKQIAVGGASYDYTFGYDSMGRFQFIFPTGNNNALFQYSYDAASNETQRYNWTNSVAQIYNRDSLNRLRDLRNRVDSYLSHSPFIDVYVGY